MRILRNVTLAALALTVVGCQQGQKLPGYASFGAPISTAKAVSLADAVAVVDADGEATVCVKAQIETVCKKRGCWMMLADGTNHVRVRFTASEKCTDGFLMPRNADGHTAYVEGTVERTSMPEELARHYAEDQGKPKAEIEKIVGPQPAVVMIATGVMISDGDKLDPPVQ